MMGFPLLSVPHSSDWGKQKEVGIPESCYAVKLVTGSWQMHRNATENTMFY